jgi:hypothetical protein
LRQQIYRAVALHEIGHAVGLRHNFSASADALNFQSEYWPLREQTIGPRAPGNVGADINNLLRSNCAMEDDSNVDACEAQRDGRMAEYQYSSIMDYGGRFNSDFHGLGHYDHAALAAGYGDLVEVFDDEVAQDLPGIVKDAIGHANSRRNPVAFTGCAQDPETGNWSGWCSQGQGIDASLGAHYTDLPRLFGGVENLEKRSWIRRSDYRPDEGDLKVPYKSCYDEYADAAEDCHRWDVGADAYEITANLLSRYKEYYVFNNFQQDRLGFSGINVLRTIAGRYLLPLTNMYQHWVYAELTTRPSGYTEGALAQLAAVEGFNNLWNIMSTPAYGCYEPNGDDIYAITGYLSEDGTCSDLNQVTIEQGEGRRMFSLFDYNSGYEVYKRVLESGHFYDQFAAVIALTTSNAQVVGIGNDVQADVLRYLLPYYLVFSGDIEQLLGSIYREDYQSYAPVIINGELVPRSIFADLSQDDTRIEADTSWTIRILSMLNGMALLSSNFDLGFTQRGQIALLSGGEVSQDGSDPVQVVGGTETLANNPNFEEIRVEDLDTGRTYAAYRPIGMTDADELAEWYGADLLEDIRDRQEAIEADPDSNESARLESEVRSNFRDVEILRSLYRVFGTAF